MTTPTSTGTEHDLRDDVRGTGYARRTRDFTESKNGFKTSELLLTVLFVAGVLIASYADNDSLAHEDGWRFAAWAVIAYVISRGLAKLGVREPYSEDRR